MKARDRVLALGLGVGVTLALVSGCNSLIGADAPNLVASFGGSGGTAGAGPSTQCLLNSECPNTEICVFRVCSQQCAADKDCSFGRCLPTSDGNACVVASAATCSTADDCPAGSACLRGACRTSCSNSSDCLADQSCIAGACVGNDSTHDPSTTSGGSGGAGAGAGGSSAGSGGHAGSGEAGSTTGGNVGEAGVGGEGGTAPECAPGDVACTGLTPLSCQDGQMKANGANCQYACTNGACAGECKVGDKACAGSTFETCGSDNTWQKTPCQFVCDATLGCTGSCTDGALQCSGTTELDVCTNGKFTKMTTCAGECAVVNKVAKCVACGDSDGICPPSCNDAKDVDCPKEPGESCSKSTDCRVGVCGAEGVCCDSACGDSCSSCKISSKAGTCTAIDFSHSSDTNNCGSCHNSCSTQNVSASCSAGVCGGSCTAGYGSCDAASVNDGCETNIASDANNCNACGTVCKYGECVNGACPSVKWGSSTHVDHDNFGSSGTPVSLIASPVTITSSGKLAALGVPVFFLTGATSVHLYVALYTSTGGALPGPGSFVAQTAELSTVNVQVSGPTEGLIQPAKAISAGDYYIVVIADAPYSVQDEGSNDTTIWYNSTTIPFGPIASLPTGLKTLSIPTPDFYAITIP